MNVYMGSGHRQPGGGVNTYVGQAATLRCRTEERHQVAATLNSLPEFREIFFLLK